MQRLILKLALFAAMLALPWGVVEWQLERIPNSYSWKRQLLERKGDVAKVLVLGSSHEYLGISPSAFDCEGLNLANTSQALFYDGEIVRRHLPQLGSLRLVLQGISYFSLEFMLSDSAEKWRGFYYRHFLGTRTDPGMSLLDLENFSLVAMYGRDQVLEFAAKRFDVSLTEHVDEYGWYDSRGNETLQPPKEDSGKAAATYHTSTMKPEHLPENVEVIARMRERLRQRGPRCGAKMRILAGIDAPNAIRKILTCLGLPTRAPPVAPALPGSDQAILW